MTPLKSRQVFGLKNAARIAGPARKPPDGKARKSIKVNPVILMGGGVLAFIAVAALFVSSSPPAPPATGLQITEVSPNRVQAKPAVPPQPPASGGKLGAATSAVQTVNR
jgi:hypothetical protein